MDFLAELVWRLVFARIVACGPKVAQLNGSLIATTRLKAHVLCLGAASRRLRIDTRAKVIHLAVRNWWLRSRLRHIPFAEVAQVQYSYHDMSIGFWTYQEQALFCVGLRLVTGEEIVLFRFFGEGDFVNDSIFPDWMYSSDILIANATRGAQETDSLRFAEIVAAMIGVPIASPDP